jgi:hypothetical protein
MLKIEDDRISYRLNRENKEKSKLKIKFRR